MTVFSQRPKIYRGVGFVRFAVVNLLLIAQLCTTEKKPVLNLVIGITAGASMRRRHSQEQKACGKVERISLFIFQFNLECQSWM